MRHQQGGEAGDQLELDARGEKNFGADGGGGDGDVNGQANDSFACGEEADELVGGDGGSGDGACQRELCRRT